MKKLLLLAILATSLTTIFAQEETAPAKVYHNELGLNVSGYVKRLFDNSASIRPAALHTPPIYLLTYRRKFEHGNIRSAVGWNSTWFDKTSEFQSGYNIYEYNYRAFILRVGWEFHENLGTDDWQLFYGLDFRPGWSHLKDDAESANGEYVNGNDTKTRDYGLAPVLGIRYKATRRLSFSVESSFAINYHIQKTRLYYSPTSSQYPSLSDEIIPTKKNIFSSFDESWAFFVAYDFW